MNTSVSLKAFAVALAIGSFGLATNASANDDAKEAVIGIIGEVISGAAAAEQADQCEQLEEKCDAGNAAACAQADASCEDDEEGDDEGPDTED